MHTRHGLMTITRLHICLPCINSKGLQGANLMVEPHWWIWHPTWHLRVESRHQNGHQHIIYQNSGRFNSEKRTYLWRTHSIIGISQKRHWRWRLLLWHGGRANNTFTLRVVVEPLHTDPMLQEAPFMEGATVTDETDDSPEDTTVTGRVVVVAIVETWDITNYKNVQEAYGHPMCWCPQTPNRWGTPPNPLHKGNIPHITCRNHKNILMHREAN